MLDVVSIKNILSHKNTILNFHPNVNTIIGLSGSGKTAVINTIRFAVFNRPLGNAFIRHGTEKASVELNFRDVVVKRFKSNKENYYRLNGEKLFFDSSNKTNVPNEVARVLNINELNFHLQGRFLIDQTPIERSRYLNEIISNKSMDESLLEADRQVRSISSEIKRKKQEADKLLKDINDTNWVDEAEKEVAIIEEEQDKLDELDSDIKELERAIEMYNKLREKYDRLKPLLKIKKELKVITDLYNDYTTTTSVIKTLEVLIDKFFTYKEQIKKNKKQLANIEEVIHEEMPEICPLCNQRIK